MTEREMEQFSYERERDKERGERSFCENIFVDENCRQREELTSRRETPACKQSLPSCYLQLGYN